MQGHVRRRGHIYRYKANNTTSLQAFPDTLKKSASKDQLDHLLSATHAVGSYRLVLKQGEPFKPVSLRVHGDPISIIGKILDQNPKSYTQIGDLIDVAGHMVMSGLTVRNSEGETTLKHDRQEQLVIAEKRVVSMCIDAALAEDDFETAYSYVITRLKDIAGPARGRAPDIERAGPGLFAEPPAKTIDDWSWRAALQAGQYRRTAQTVKPTHIGNTSGNPEIRHLEQRMTCLAQALRIAPKSTLQMILDVYRRCEEELESQVKLEAEQEAALDSEVDDQFMPGGFAATPAKKDVSISNSRAVEEAPMSLFDLSRASMARAQNGFSALSRLKGSNGTSQEAVRHGHDGSAEHSRVSTPENSFHKGPTRKRDQLKNAAVGGLATGVGWLLGAPAVNHDNDGNEE